MLQDIVPSKQTLVALAILASLLMALVLPASLVAAPAEAPLAAPQVCAPPVFVNEFHYDNDGGDIGEFIEVAGPASTDLTGWSLALYNGSNGTVYATINLTGSIDDEGSGFGALAFPQASIQNGDPDGFALVNASAVVQQFLSYEGTFTATNGPANGMTSTDVGVSEPSNTPAGQSLQLIGTGECYDDFTWTGPVAESPGDINTSQTFEGAPPAPILINEFVVTPTGSEAIELYNTTGSDIDVSGWTVDWSTGSGIISAGQVVSATDFLVLTTANVPGLALSNAGTVLTLSDVTDAVVDSVGYGNSGAAPKPFFDTSAGRAPNGTDTGDDAADFNWTATPTMGAANTQPAADLGSSVVINEVDPNGGAPAFIELYNPTGSTVDLENWLIAVDDDYFIPAGQSIAAGGFWVLNEADFPQFFALDASGDQVYLYDAAGVRVDQVGWNTAPGSSWNRLPDGAGPNDGWNDATSQLVAQTPTPNATNVLPVAPDWVINEILADPDAVNGDANGDGVVDTSEDEFVEIVNNSGAAMDISGWTLSDAIQVRHTFPAGTIIPDECSVVVFGGGTPTGSFGNSVVQTASTGSLGLNNTGDTVTLNDGINDVVSYTYGSEANDNQSITRDPDITGPDPLVKHSTATGSGGALFSPGTQIDGSAFFGCLAACGATSTPIHDIQGSGLVSPIVGQQVFAEALVIADYQDVSSISGFFMEEPDGEQDADPATSEGIFIYDNNFGVDVAVGDYVRVSGTVAEYQEQTQLTSITSVTLCENDPVSATPVTVTLPFSETVYPERFEGMSVTMPQTMTVSENYNLGRGGILTLSNGRLQQPTNVVDPGAPANAMQDANNLNQITLDDGSLAQNPDPIVYPPPQLTALNSVRSGDEVNDILGVMTQGTPGWSSAGILYRVYPYEMPTFTAANPRPVAPDPVRAGSSLRVSSFNVLNYFLTLANSGLICGPNQNEECRGAYDSSEFTRQRDKLLQALYILDADVLGLMELENTPGVEPLADLVDGLNGLTAPGTYDYVDVGTFDPGDVIKVGIIYKPAVVQPVGDFAILNSLVDPAFDTSLNRPALAQTFDEVANHGRFTVVVNHLKSKGCTGATGLNADQGDGQSCWNLTRTEAVGAELNWIAGDPTNSGDPDFIILGDLNSYAKEDPIAALESAGYTNLESTFVGPDAYSYVYFAQAGSLDHSMASPSMAPQVNGATTWHINADEPSVLDYNEDFKSANQLIILYNADEYRTSDHDPLLIGLNLEPSEADLFVSKIANPDPVMIGETLYYTITTQNVSTPTVATDVVITDVLPAGVTFNGAAAYTGTCNESGGTVVCDMGNIAPDVIESVLISVTVDTAQCPGVLSNYVEVASNVYDPNPQNNSQTLETDVECVPPNIDVSPLSLASAQAADTQVTQQLNVGNTGSQDLTWTIDEEPVVLGGEGLAPRATASADTGSRGGAAGGPAPIVYDSPADFSEGFDDITLLPGQGWYFQNNSQPLGATDWFQGNDTVFPAQAGASTAYIAANYNNTGDNGTISNWMLTPEISLNDGDTVSFWTRVPTGGGTFPDRLELRLSTAGASTNVGTLATDVGDFTTLLLSVNPTLTTTGYPEVWTQYTATLTGIPGGATGRIGFRYYVTDAGFFGNNSNYIGIDTVEYTSGATTPCTALADVPWLSVAPDNGTTTGGGSVPVDVTFDSTGYAVGSYYANLCITSNDPDPGPGNGTDLVIVPVTLTVTPPTAVALTDLAADNGDLPISGTAAAVSAFLAAALTAVFVTSRRRRQRN